MASSHTGRRLPAFASCHRAVGAPQGAPGGPEQDHRVLPGVAPTAPAAISPAQGGTIWVTSQMFWFPSEEGGMIPMKSAGFPGSDFTGIKLPLLKGPELWEVTKISGHPDLCRHSSTPIGVPPEPRMERPKGRSARQSLQKDQDQMMCVLLDVTCYVLHVHMCNAYIRTCNKGVDETEWFFTLHLGRRNHRLIIWPIMSLIHLECLWMRYCVFYPYVSNIALLSVIASIPSVRRYYCPNRPYLTLPWV